MAAAAAATGVLSLCTGTALADSGASGAAADSPGILSGNGLQAPVDVPVNLCGNSVDVLAALNPAFGNSCANESSSVADGSQGGTGGTFDDEYGLGVSGGSSAEGGTSGSPGVESGNHTQVPVDVPVNACGNSGDLIGLLNPSFGNDCEQPGYVDTPTTNPTPRPIHPTQPPTTPSTAPPAPGSAQLLPTGGAQKPPQLADTGSEGMLGVSAAGAALVAGGALLYRRSRSAAHR